MTTVATRAPRARRSGSQRFLRQFFTTPTAVAGVVVLAAFVLLALTAPLWIHSTDLDVTKVNGPALHAPTAGYPLGTDQAGRSVLDLVVWGSRPSLLIGVIATVLTIGLGSLIGLVAGHFGGWVSRILMTLTDWFIVLPALPLAISLAAVLGQGSVSITVAIAVTSWPGAARLVRAQTLAVEARPFVERARALGAGDLQVMSRQVLPERRPAHPGVEHADGGERDPVGDHADLPRPGRQHADLLGRHAQRGPAHRGHLGRRLVVPRPAGHRDPRRRARLHVRGPRGRGGPQPAARERPVTALLDVRGLGVTYRAGTEDVPAVRDVSFSLGAGETLGLAGESGSGKSTVALSLLRLLPASARVTGTIALAGEELTTATWGRLRAVRWAEASVVFQGAQNALNPVRSIGEQIREPILLHEKVGRRAADARVDDLLDSVGVPARRAGAYPHELSGGQRQRVMIAMALACRPKLSSPTNPPRRST